MKRWQSRHFEDGKAKTFVEAYIPTAVKETLGSITRKQWLDIGIFAGGVYVMYNYGGKIAETVDSNMPSEEGIQKAM